jgi:hypothetical protein
LATWRPIALRKKTRKEQPGNTGLAYKQQRLGKSDLQVLRTNRPARKDRKVLVEFDENRIVGGLGSGVARS